MAGKINKDQNHFLDIAKRNVNRLARLINEVLDFQKLAANKMKFHIQETDHREVIKDAYDTMLPYAKKKKVNLSIELDDNAPRVKFDSDKIIQALTNLVNNAIKFTEEGSITIATRRIENVIQLSISDTGCGIRQEDMPRLFRRFEQLATGGDRKTGGTGLGLAISQMIINNHNGNITIRSAENMGTTVNILLPLK